VPAPLREQRSNRRPGRTDADNQNIAFLGILHS